MFAANNMVRGNGISRRQILRINSLTVGQRIVLLCTLGMVACQPVTIPAPQPGAITRDYVDGPYGQIHFHHSGDRSSNKTPLLLLHPTASSGAYFRDFMAEISQDRYVIATDTPGYGRSDSPSEPQSVEALSEALMHVVRALKLREFDVLGQNTGSVLGTELAIKHPDKVRRLILLGLPVHDDAERQEMYQIYAAPEVIPEDIEYVGRYWRGYVTNREPGESLEHAAVGFVERMHSYPRSHWAYHSVFTYPLQARLPKITQAVLIPNLYGEGDPREKNVADLIPSATYMADPGLPRNAFYVGAERMAEITRDYLD